MIGQTGLPFDVDALIRQPFEDARAAQAEALQKLQVIEGIKRSREAMELEARKVDMEARKTASLLSYYAQNQELARVETEDRQARLDEWKSSRSNREQMAALDLEKLRRETRTEEALARSQEAAAGVAEQTATQMAAEREGDEHLNRVVASGRNPVTNREEFNAIRRRFDQLQANVQLSAEGKERVQGIINEARLELEAAEGDAALQEMSTALASVFQTTTNKVGQPRDPGEVQAATMAVRSLVQAAQAGAVSHGDALKQITEMMRAAQAEGVAGARVIQTSEAIGGLLVNMQQQLGGQPATITHMQRAAEIEGLAQAVQSGQVDPEHAYRLALDAAFDAPGREVITLPGGQRVKDTAHIMQGGRLTELTPKQRAWVMRYHAAEISSDPKVSVLLKGISEATKAMHSGDRREGEQASAAFEKLVKALDGEMRAAANRILDADYGWVNDLPEEPAQSGGGLDYGEEDAALDFPASTGGQ